MLLILQKFNTKKEIHLLAN